MIDFHLLPCAKRGGVPAERGRGPVGGAGRNAAAARASSAHPRGPSTAFRGPPPHLAMGRMYGSALSPGAAEQSF